jgi:hypothetical protein
MKLALALAAILSSAPVLAQQLVPVSVHDLFVPSGFDDNDETLAVLDGYLPNSCYRLAHSQASFDAATRAYRVTQFAWLHPSTFCLQIVTPFTTEVRLGVVPAGSYQVLAEGSVARPLAVKNAMRPGPDEYPYAPVEEARVDYDASRDRYVAILRGRMMSSCMNLSDPLVINSGRTLEVLPIVALASGNDCKATNRPFEHALDLPAGLANGRYLLHVRSLSGKSINVVFTAYTPRAN